MKKHNSAYSLILIGFGIFCTTEVLIYAMDNGNKFNVGCKDFDATFIKNTNSDDVKNIEVNNNNENIN